MKDPFISTMRFREIGAYVANEEKTFDDIINAAKNNLDQTYLKDVYFDTQQIKDDDYSFSGNFKVPFKLFENFTGYFKTGVKYNSKSRSSDVNRTWTGNFVGKDILLDGTQDPSWNIDVVNQGILMSSFLGDYKAKSFSRFFDQALFLGPGPGELTALVLTRIKWNLSG